MGDTNLISSSAQLLNAIAWPVVALSGGLFFNSDNKALLSQIRKGGGRV